jgi:hypothetical protein
MTRFRSYFSKNNTLIRDNESNNSQNPVTEISYGTFDKQLSRFIFDVDLDALRDRISGGSINSNRIVKHVLHLTNTISYAPQYIGRKSYSTNINRASSFDLTLFNITQEWDEGSGYDFIYNETLIATEMDHASNWYLAKRDTDWNIEGGYDTGFTETIGTQHFDNGNENVSVDVTGYINQRLFGVSGNTSGVTYSGESFGLGLKFGDYYESLEAEFREAVAFHTKYTNTFYEPYIETIIDDTISDDRNFFHLNNDNELYLYGNSGDDVIVSNVDIYNQDDELHQTISGDSIIDLGNGIFKIVVNVDSYSTPDAVMFRDEWNLIVNGRSIMVENDFYLRSDSTYDTFFNSSEINFDNYYFYYNGIEQDEIIFDNDFRKVNITFREMYPNQDTSQPLDIEYRIFTTTAEKYEVNVIPFTKANRTNKGYEFNVDFSWLIPQDYKIQIRLKNGTQFRIKETLSFTVASEGIVGI